MGTLRTNFLHHRAKRAEHPQASCPATDPTPSLSRTKVPTDGTGRSSSATAHEHLSSAKTLDSTSATAMVLAARHVTSQSWIELTAADLADTTTMTCDIMRRTDTELAPGAWTLLMPQSLLRSPIEL